MSTPAKVHSSEAIEAVRMALMSFAEQVGDALTELSAEMRRMQEWLEHDRPRFWKTQIRRAGDMEHEAKQALHRCLMFPVANERPSCTEERTALKKAQARLAYCQEKEDRVRHWQQTMRHELFEYEGRMSQLVRLVEVEVPQAIGVLNKILRNLEEYHAVRAATRARRTTTWRWRERFGMTKGEAKEGEAETARPLQRPGMVAKTKRCRRQHAVKEGNLRHLDAKMRSSNRRGPNSSRARTLGNRLERNLRPMGRLGQPAVSRATSGSDDPAVETGPGRDLAHEFADQRGGA